MHRNRRCLNTDDYDGMITHCMLGWIKSRSHQHLQPLHTVLIPLNSATIVVVVIVYYASQSAQIRRRMLAVLLTHTRTHTHTHIKKIMNITPNIRRKEHTSLIHVRSTNITIQILIIIAQIKGNFFANPFTCCNRWPSFHMIRQTITLHLYITVIFLNELGTKICKPLCVLVLWEMRRQY